MTKEPQEECKHLWDCKEYNPKCHICGKLMRDDSFYDEDDHCNHAWEEGKLYCMYCGKSRETFTPMTPQEETYQTLENKALEEFREKFNSAIDPDARGKDSVIEQFWKSHLQLAYKAGEEKGRDSVPSITGIEITYPDVRQQAIAEERERIIKWAEKYMDKTTKYYGTDKHGIALDDLIQELQNK